MITGHWSGNGLAFTVIDRGGDLLVTSPDVPFGFEPRLVPTDDGWQVTGGPFGDVPVALDGNALVMAGTFRLEPMAEPPVLEPGHGLAPPDPPPPDIHPTLVDLWATAQGLDGGVLDLPDEVAAHHFVQWLMARDALIFHGSNSRDIDEFQPRRTSMELNDAGGRGNLGAVYGTHDGLWSMFFAVVDRRTLRGSIRNGVSRYDSPDGDHVDVYHFSVNSGSLPDRPFTDGALYLLPRTTFSRIPLYPGGPPSPEWASTDPVAPIARILLEPADFPFLDRVGGHDDGPLIELEELNKAVMDAATDAVRLEGGFRITTGARPDEVERWAGLAASFFPDVRYDVETTKHRTEVTITGPPALVHTLEDRLADLV